MTLQRQGFYLLVPVHENRYGTSQTGGYNHVVFHKVCSDCARDWDISGASHGISCRFSPLDTFLPKRHAEHLKQLPGFIVIAGCSNDGYFQTA
jgi:hypothetical protein